MPQTIIASLETNPSARITLRWQEPYLTEGSNKRLGGVLPAGTYRGFRLGTSVTNGHATLVADATYGDHVAQFVQSDGTGLTIRITGGSIDMDLTSEAGNDVVLVLFASFVIGTTTHADIRAYTFAEFAALGTSVTQYLVVLGCVHVPPTGPVSISYGLAGVLTSPFTSVGPAGAVRTEAGMTGSAQVRRWAQIVKNGNFAGAANGATNYNIRHWQEPASFWVVTNADPITSQDIHVVQAAAGVSPSSYSGTLSQYLNVPVPPQSLVRVQFKIKMYGSPVLPSGSMQVTLTFQDEQGTTTSTTVVYTDPLSAADASYRTIDTVVLVPASYYSLQSVALAIANWQVPSGSGGVKIGDVNVWLEQQNPTQMDTALERKGVSINQGLLIEAPGSAYSDPAALLSLDNSNSTEPRLSSVRSDLALDATHLPPFLNWQGRVRAGQAYAFANAPLTSTSAMLGVYGSSPSISYWPVLQSDPAVTGLIPSSRIYSTGDGGLAFAINCYWDGAHWNKDQPGTASLLSLPVTGAGITYAVRSAGHNGTWTATGWDFTPISGAGDGPVYASALNIGSLIAIGAPQLTGGAGQYARLQSGVEVDGQCKYTLFAQIGNSGQTTTRLYVAFNGQFTLTINALYVPSLFGGGGGWQADVSGNGATKFQVGPYGLASIGTKNNASTPWPDTGAGSWDSFTGLQAGNGAATFADTATVYANSVVKAYGGTGTPSSVGSLNVANVTTVTSGKKCYQVTLGAPMADTNYIVLLSDRNGGAVQNNATWYPLYTGVTTSSFLIAAASAGLQIDVTSIFATCDFMVFGNAPPT